MAFLKQKSLHEGGSVKQASTVYISAGTYALLYWIVTDSGIWYYYYFHQFPFFMSLCVILNWSKGKKNILLFITEYSWQPFHSWSRLKTYTDGTAWNTSLNSEELATLTKSLRFPMYLVKCHRTVGAHKVYVLISAGNQTLRLQVCHNTELLWNIALLWTLPLLLQKESSHPGFLTKATKQECLVYTSPSTLREND